jgi:putative transposase
LDYQYPESVVIRGDNGSQFIAINVREYLGLIGVQQVFTHVATPEENAHIEAYHGILKKMALKEWTIGPLEKLNRS